MCMCMFVCICIWWINLLNIHFCKLIFGDDYFSNTKKKKVYNQSSMIKLLKIVSFWLHNCLLQLN